MSPFCDVIMYQYSDTLWKQIFVQNHGLHKEYKEDKYSSHWAGTTGLPYLIDSVLGGFANALKFFCQYKTLRL